ncbi:MAG: hypothetical protein NTW28_05265 [Candidatus Solibacter sp.]|nr:hypothetical protein [Candidatus Solibacter sp.]
MPSPKQTVGYPFWLTAGIGGVVLLALFTALQSYRSADAYARAYQDPYMIQAQPERLREAVRYLPGKAVIGYLSDLPFDAVPGQSAHFGIMYALAPRLVTRSADSHEWVVGNFSHPLDYAAAGSAHHLDLVKDFGNGIVLFRRRSQ